MNRALVERMRFPRWAAGLAAVVLVATSCDGRNRFSTGPIEETPIQGDPPVVQIEQPAAGAEKLIGDSVFVSVRASDDLALDSVVLEGIAIRGDAALGTEEIVSRFAPKTVFLDSATADTTVVRYLFPTDEDAVETALIVAKVFDAEGLSAVDTVSIELVESAPPIMEILVPSASPITVLPLGDSLRVVARGADDLGVDSIVMRGVALRGDPTLGNQQEVARFGQKTVPTFGARDTTVARYLIPTAETARENAFIIAEAFDADLKVGADTVQIVVGLTDRPNITITTPAASPIVEKEIGDSILVSIDASDDFGLLSVRLVGVAVRGDPALGNQQFVTRYNPKEIQLGGVQDTTLTRYLNASTSVAEESAFIIAEAVDIDGFLTADTVQVRIVAPPEPIPPQLEILDPRGDSLSAKPLGDSIFVRVRAVDDVGIQSVTFTGISFRGDPALGTDEIVQRFFTKTVPGRSATDTTVMRYLLPTADAVNERAFIVAEVLDDEGLVTRDSVAVFLGGPDVELLGIQEGQSVQAGLSLNLGAIAKDPNGITRLELVFEGAIDTVLTRNLNPAADSTRFDATVAIPDSAIGELRISARATSGLDVLGQDGPLTITVIPIEAGDTIRPSAALSVQVRERYELTDSIFVTVTGQDDTQGSGVVKAGYTARAISLSQGDTAYVSGEAEFSPLTGTVTRTFGFQTFNVDALSLPDTVRYEITGYLIDADGNCAATTATTGTAVPCDTTTVPGRVLAEDRPGLRFLAGHVSGRTVTLPRGGSIADAVADTARRNLFLSNPLLGRVEVFDIQTATFERAIGAGSLPWGLALTRANDSLWVANSGGTNFSVIDLNTLQEVDDNRFFTPDVTLWDVEIAESDAGIQAIVSFFPQAGETGFTDHPQFVAVDVYGNPIYSTTVLPSGALGTARKAFFPPGAEASEVKLFTEHGGTTNTENFFAFANVDNVVVTTTTSDEVDADGNPIEVTTSALTVFDHVPGFPSQVITGAADISGGETPDQAGSRLRAEGSDVEWYSNQRWNIESLGFGDTTYVAASGDGRWVAIGEGARPPAARVLMYEAAQLDTTRLSGVIPVTDFLTNTGERVRGVGVNYDGTMSVARGDRAYFFSNDLRQQGFTPISDPALGAGAVFHPLHANQRTLANLSGQYDPDSHLALVGAGNRTIEIIDTQRYSVIGVATIRDVINGPLKATLPFPEDNVGLTCATDPVSDRYGNMIGNAVRLYEGNSFLSPIAPDGVTEDACIVLNVYAVTSAGGVVVVPVRKADILRRHPARTGN